MCRGVREENEVSQIAPEYCPLQLDQCAPDTAISSGVGFYDFAQRPVTILREFGLQYTYYVAWFRGRSDVPPLGFPF